MANGTGQDNDVSSPVEQLKWIFDLCDQDHDGLITVEEFRSLGQHYLGLGTVSQRIEVLINDIDPDCSGVITFDSFRRGIEAYLIARRESVSSSRSGSISRASVDEGFVIDSPSSENSLTAEDISHSTNTPFFPPSLGFNDVPRSIDREPIPNCSTELATNGMDDSNLSIDSYNSLDLRTSSFPDIEIQVSDNSPTLIAKSLRRNNHSYLRISGTGSSFSSTPEWRVEDHDELTDKLQELSTRLEGLEMDLDSSQSEKIRLKKENGTLRERLETFQDTLRDVEFEKEDAIKQIRNESNTNLSKLKKEHKNEIEELQYQLHQEQTRNNSLEGNVSSLLRQLEDKELECQDKLTNNSILQESISELQGMLAKAKDQLREEKEKWEHKSEESQQELVAMTHVIEHLRKELEENKFTKKRNSTTNSDMRMGEIMLLKKEVKTLKEERDRLSSQLLRQGQLLVAEQPKSLADELKDAPKADVMKALKEQEEMNIRLKAYIEGLLLTILNSHPELLEIKAKKK